MTTFLDRIEAQLQRHRDAAAVVDLDRTVSYGRLWEEVSACARGLAVSSGPVGILLPNTGLGLVALLAVLRTGSPAVLYPPGLDDEELRRCVRVAGVRVLVSTAPYQDVLARLGGRRLRESALPAGPAGGLVAVPLDVPARGWARRGDCLVQLTSGADAPSKLAIRTHAAVSREIEDYVAALRLGALDRVLVLPSIAHSYGLLGGALAPLCQGAAVVLGTSVPGAGVFDRAAASRATIVFAVPRTYEAVASRRPRAADFTAEEEPDLSSVRLWLSAGAPLPDAVDAAFALRSGRHAAQNYGTTEAGVLALRLEWSPESSATVGRPLPGRTITITSPAGEPLPPGQVGGVVVSSPTLARAWLVSDTRDPVSIGAQFVTGDLGRVTASGELVLVGRRSSIIDLPGGTVEAPVVEAVIARLPGVREAAVVAIDGPRGRRLKAVVAAEGLSDAVVRGYCRQCLGPWQVPDIVEFRPALPRTAAGKVLRRLLR